MGKPGGIGELRRGVKEEAEETHGGRKGSLVLDLLNLTPIPRQECAMSGGKCTAGVCDGSPGWSQLMTV